MTQTASRSASVPPLAVPTRLLPRPAERSHSSPGTRAFLPRFPPARSHGALWTWSQITSLPALDPPTAVLCMTRKIQTARVPVVPPLEILCLSSRPTGFLFLPTGHLHVPLLLPRTFFPLFSAYQAPSHHPGPSPKAPSSGRPPKLSDYNGHSHLVSRDTMFCLPRGPFLLGTCPICSFQCSFSVSPGMLVCLTAVSQGLAYSEYSINTCWGVNEFCN